MVRPFKVAFSDIQNHYSNIKTNDSDNVMMDIITNVLINLLKSKYLEYHDVNHF